MNWEWRILLLIILASALQTPAEVQQGSEPPHASGFYYYCNSAKAYYPTVSQCPDGWIATPVGAPPPARPERRWYEYESQNDSTVKAKPNAVTLDLLGRALVYSVNYDHAFGEHSAVGIGYSSWQANNHWQNYQSNITVIPVYANYYFTQHITRAFLSVGADIIQVSNSGFDSSPFANDGVAATMGGGVEVREPAGFILRLGAFLIIGTTTALSPEIGLGFAF